MFGSFTGKQFVSARIIEVHKILKTLEMNITLLILEIFSIVKKENEGLGMPLILACLLVWF